MTTGTKTNVIVGAAKVYLASSSTVVPTPVAADRYNTTVEAAAGWTDVGYTQNGVEISYEPTYTDVEVDQLLDSARVFKSGMRVTIMTTFAEATLQNLLFVWAQAASSLTTYTGSGDASTSTSALMVMQGGHLGEAPLERKFIAIGNGPEIPGSGYSERTYTATRVLSVDTSAHSMRRTDPTVFPISFRLLPDDTVTASPYGTIRDRLPTGTWA